MKLSWFISLCFLFSQNTFGADKNVVELCKNINLGMFARENMDELIEYDGTKCLFEDNVYQFNYPDIRDRRKEIYWENLTTGKTWWFKDVVVDFKGASRYCKLGKEGFRPLISTDVPHEYSTMKLFSEVFQFQNRAESRINRSVGFRLLDTGSKNRRRLFTPYGSFGGSSYMAHDERHKVRRGHVLHNIPFCIKDAYYQSRFPNKRHFE